MPFVQVGRHLINTDYVAFFSVAPTGAAWEVRAHPTYHDDHFRVVATRGTEEAAMKLLTDIETELRG